MFTPGKLRAAGTLAVPATGAYTGAYIDFGETEDNVTLAGIQKFDALVGKHQAIVASSSFWGRGAFPTENARLIADHGSVPMLYWSPWGPPYEQGEDVRPDAFSLARIVAGDIDPSFVVTHPASLEDAPEMYKKFRDKKDGVIKVVLRP